VTALQKYFSHRKGAKGAKIFKDEVQNFKSFSKRFALPARINNFLRALRFFAVKRFVFQWAYKFLREN